MFWFDKQNPVVEFIDVRNEQRVVDIGTPGTKGRSPRVIAPDRIADFRNMPFSDCSFYHVVFDPPHLLRACDGGVMTFNYGKLKDSWKEDLRKGFAECFRVLKIHGILVFKWCETEIPLREVLSLTPEKPLYGHRSGKKSNTHWVAFMKEERTSCAQDSPAQNTMEICHTAPNSASAT
jgi:hypothetical protein